MENQIIKDCVTKRKYLNCSVCEHYIETNINLADYHPDIVKILNLYNDINIYSAEISGNRLNIEGSVTVRMVYSSENMRINVFDTVINFSKITDINEECENAFVSVSGKSDKLICKAVNPKKAEIRGNIFLNICVYNNDGLEYITDCECEDIQMKKCSFDGLKMCSGTVDVFSQKESFDASGTVKPSQILRLAEKNSITGVKAVSDKVMLKGITTITVYYIDENGEFKTQNNDMNFSKIIDCPGACEDSLFSYSLNVRSRECDIVHNAGSPNGRFDISLIYECEMKCFDNYTLRSVIDAYSTEYNTELNTVNIPQIKELISVNEILSDKYNAVFNEPNVKNTVDCYVKNINYSKKLNNGQLCINGDFSVGIIYINEDDTLCYGERIFDFNFEKQYDGNASECEISIRDISAVCLSSDKNSITLGVDLNISGNIYIIRNITVLSDIIFGSTINENDKSGINIYFAHENEDLWDIAKSYKANIDEIKCLNNLDRNVLDSDKTLIFSSL